MVAPGDTKYDLLEYLQEVGQAGVTSCDVAEAFGPFPKVHPRHVRTAAQALLRLSRRGLASRTVELGPGQRRRKGMTRWIYRYRITPRGAARLAWWRG